MEIQAIPTSPAKTPPVKGHCTLVCGWDAAGTLAYLRTFDYEGSKVEKALADEALKWCIDNCAGGWMIGDKSTLVIKELPETQKDLKEAMLEKIFVLTGGREENVRIAEVCAELAAEYYNKNK